MSRSLNTVIAVTARALRNSPGGHCCLMRAPAKRLQRLAVALSTDLSDIADARGSSTVRPMAASALRRLTVVPAKQRLSMYALQVLADNIRRAVVPLHQIGIFVASTAGLRDILTVNGALGIASRQHAMSFMTICAYSHVSISLHQLPPVNGGQIERVLIRRNPVGLHPSGIGVAA